MKIVFINVYSLYGKEIELYEPGTDAFFQFGMGQFIAEKFHHFGYEITFESWRLDQRISKLMEKEIDGIVYRIFPSIKHKVIGEFSIRFAQSLIKSSMNKDVVFHFMGSHMLNFHILNFLARKRKSISTHLGGANPLWKYRENKKLGSYVYYLFERFIFLKYYDHFLTICKPEVEYYKSMRLNVTHMPVFGISREHDFIIKDRIECRNRLGLPLNKKILLQVGRATQDRGFDWIIELIDHYQKNEEYFMVFVGVHKEDPYFADLNQRNVLIIDYVDVDDLCDYYNAADVLIFLLHNKLEMNFGGTGYVPMESLICGTPVISTTFNSFPDPSINEVSRIPQSYEEVIPMIEDILKTNISREKCREIVMETFSWEKVITKHYELYSSTQ